MSNIYFCFSDENGDYKKEMSKKQLGRHPFYVRSTLIMNASEWKMLNSKFRIIKAKYGLPEHKEVKWSQLWSLRNFKKNQKEIPENHEIKFLDKFDYHEIIKFVEESIAILSELVSPKVIITYTRNSDGTSINEKAVLKMHLQEHMQRVEMELNHKDENLAIIFIDPVSNVKNDMFREIYSELYENGDFIEKYSAIKDSLNIENSHQSTGIQIADYISGSFSAVLKSEMGDYALGVKMFTENIKSILRGYPNNIHGYGIREVPRSSTARKWISEIIERHC